MSTIAADVPLVVEVAAAIRAGDLAALRKLLRDHPDLAAARVGDEAEARTLLHVATDWPGHFPNGPAVVAALVEAGADLNWVGWNDQTPLDIAEAQGAGEVVEWLRSQGARSAAEPR
jgi:uncharacterized protein